MKALRVYVYYNKLFRGCANGGPSETHETALLIDCDGPVDEAKDGELVLKLVKRNIRGREYLHAVEVGVSKPGHNGPMMGGNFIHSSDSRFPSDYPIAIHDRFEVPSRH